MLFLRFGYAVANTGLLGTVLIILIGHAVTIPTALAISEIATNRRVEGGGEYFIISRSFGTTIGATIGIALFLSQAISVAFYSIAFAEAFQPLAPWIEELTGLADTMREDLGDARTGHEGKNCRPIERIENPKPLTNYDPDHPYIIAMYDIPNAG